MPTTATIAATTTTTTTTTTTSTAAAAASGGDEDDIINDDRDVTSALNDAIVAHSNGKLDAGNNRVTRTPSGACR